MSAVAEKSVLICRYCPQKAKAASKRRPQKRLFGFFGSPPKKFFGDACQKEDTQSDGAEYEKIGQLGNGGGEVALKPGKYGHFGGAMGIEEKHIKMPLLQDSRIKRDLVKDDRRSQRCGKDGYTPQKRSKIGFNITAEEQEYADGKHRPVAHHSL